MSSSLTLWPIINYLKEYVTSEFIKEVLKIFLDRDPAVILHKIIQLFSKDASFAYLLYFLIMV